MSYLYIDPSIADTDCLYIDNCYLDGSGQPFAVFSDKVNNIVHACSVAGVETVTIGSLPGSGFHHQS